ANRLAVQRHYQAHGGATGFGDLPEGLLQLFKFRLSFLPILLSLLCGLICLLLLGDGLLSSKLRVRFRVRLGLLGQVALLRGRLRVRSRLRSLLSQGLGLLLCPLDEPAETFRLLAEP